MYHAKFLICLAFIIIGCTKTPVTVVDPGAPRPYLVSQSDDKKGLLRVNSLLIFPPSFERASEEKLSNSVYSLLVGAFQDDSEVQIKGNDDVLGAARAMGSNPGSDKLSNLAKKFGSDSVLLTTIHSFKERSGSNVGSSDPGEVKFSMAVMQMPQGKEVWRGSFVFKGEAVSDNLLHMDSITDGGRGLAWKNTSDILERGFREASREFSTRRLESFAPGHFSTTKDRS